MRHLITREIGIDAGHRVTFHGSKCKNLHGHRYTIFATCDGPLFTEGEQQGMVLDFGFLKAEMMAEIDDPCDHGMILWREDPFLPQFLPSTRSGSPMKFPQREFAENGYLLLKGGAMGKLYVLPYVPTAENLAMHWFNRLAPRVKERSEGKATLVKVKVQETPNCSAEYPGGQLFGENTQTVSMMGTTKIP